MYLCLTWVSSAERFTRNHPACLGPSSSAVLLLFFPTEDLQEAELRKVSGRHVRLARGPAVSSGSAPSCVAAPLLQPSAGGAGGILEDVALAIIWEALMQGGIHGALCNLGSGENTGT